MVSSSPPHESNSSACKGEHLQRLSDVLFTKRQFPRNLNKTVTELLTRVDGIHRVSGMPQIEVSRSCGVGEHTSRFKCNRDQVNGGIGTCRIWLQTRGEDRDRLSIQASFLHELGHAIDVLALGNRTHAVNSMENAEWREWSVAVNSSAHARDMRSIASCPCPVSQSIRGDDCWYKQTAKGNAKPNELWARSYAQYIALKIHDDELLWSLRSLTDKPFDHRPDLSIYRQWDDEDFQPILDAIDRLFAHLGWLNRETLT